MVKYNSRIALVIVFKTFVYHKGFVATRPAFEGTSATLLAARGTTSHDVIPL